MTDEAGMQLALAQAERGLAAGEPPFGVVIIAPDGTVVAAGFDTVRTARDWTYHAEIETVRAACRSYGPDLTGCTLFTTVEPCPMCFTSAWLARISRLVFGATMVEVDQVTDGQQRELDIPAGHINGMSPAPLELIGGVLRKDCVALFHRHGAVIHPGA
ncbi:MAG TPA: nucleoside deaminase [Chthoniobacteraceae bacterium]|jgi:tRNA(Arg) A34 adenosine deaminase TadA